MTQRVRAGSTYFYDPFGIDLFDPPVGVERGILKPGDLVKVVNRFGSPPANTMGHAYIETHTPGDKDGEFAGLVHTSSLVGAHYSVVGRAWKRKEDK
jgi:hypothetical protein